MGSDFDDVDLMIVAFGFSADFFAAEHSNNAGVVQEFQFVLFDKPKSSKLIGTKATSTIMLVANDDRLGNFRRFTIANGFRVLVTMVRKPLAYVSADSLESLRISHSRFGILIKVARANVNGQPSTVKTHSADFTPPLSSLTPCTLVDRYNRAIRGGGARLERNRVNPC
ncbi:hypothetical protein K239x_48540 [Planctomycetes bacterium K23_9]|uniref:Uncharacterized protein n=1 Tax=Stieleria marina TaxID=1930275 RepID=A0A517P0E8_9BACT|nr:hypothetical protein K239x_48540 [Planctomycetes bacterium K23_9]